MSLVYRVADADNPSDLLAVSKLPIDQQQRILYAAVQVACQAAAVWDILWTYCPDLRKKQVSLELIHSAYRAGYLGKMVGWPWIERQYGYLLAAITPTPQTRPAKQRRTNGARQRTGN